MPSKRRPHPKTRSGCRNCKARKIKCDEGKPACLNCVKRKEECEFVTLSRPSPVPSTGGLNLADLELLHNFTTMTYATMSEDPTVREFYRISLVQVGLSRDYIMQAVLAISSLHLAHHRHGASDHYQSLAMSHHERASRAALDLVVPDLSPDDAQILFLFSVLTTFYGKNYIRDGSSIQGDSMVLRKLLIRTFTSSEALGWPRKPDDKLLIGETAFPTWVFLLRGTHGFVEVAGVPDKGPISPLFKQAAVRFELREAAHAQQPCSVQPLVDLQTRVAQQQLSAEMQTTYHNAIEELKKSFALAGQSGTQPYMMVDTFTWFYMVAGDFIPLLQIPTPEAIAIFTFFCVLLKKHDHHWWVRGWPEQLIEQAYSMLDDERRLWIRWPIEEIGWIPPSARWP
ncbi:hypothetical protein BX600DRAFT_227643 [Xylariales sp. PMI_506]|nr:hypothetical protein BX600DRAFT_227643 [Xylariales sp. PMI_506]